MADHEPETDLIAPDDAGLQRAVELLRAGDLVAFPTETVYGIGADAKNDAAVARIFDAKGRPAFNPLIIHVHDLSAARQIADLGKDALRLAEAFWPGPLTLVVPLKPGSGIAPGVSAGLPTIAIRVPEHQLARELLRRFGGPVAAPSANPSGKISPTRAEHVLVGLSGRIAAVVDGGPSAIGVESTIIGFDPDARLLRPGGLPLEIVNACLGHQVRMPETRALPNAPGQLASHYAPRAKLRLDATERRAGELLLGFGDVECDLNLSPTGDLAEAAANLFSALHILDRKASGVIAVSPIPGHGLGLGINDRLKRAAAPRS